MDEDLYIPGFTNDLASSFQSHPTEQPVQTKTEYGPLDLGDWSIATMQGLMNNPAFSTDAVNKYIADQGAAGKEVVSLNPYAASGVGPDSINANIWNAYNQFDPNNPGATTGQVFRFDIGQNEGTAPVVLAPGASYTLTDGKGQNTLGTASTPEQMQALIDQANAQKYGWNLYQTNATGGYTPGTQLFGETDTRPTGVMGALVNYGLPIAVGLLTGGVGSLPSLGWGTTAGLMGATGLASGILGGKSIDDALLQGVITGGTAGLLKAPIFDGGASIGSTIGNYLDKVPGVGDALRTVNNTLGLGGTAGSSVWNPAEGITVTAGHAVNPLLTGALSSTLGNTLLNDAVLRNALSSGYTAPAEPSLEQQFDDILVKGNRLPLENLPVAPVAGGAITSGYDPVQNEITAVADKTKPNLGDTAPAVVGSVAPELVDPNDIVVSNKYKPQSFNDILAGAVGAVAPTLINTGVTQPTTTTPSKKLTLADYLRLAGLASTAIGGLTNNKGSPSNFSGMRGPLNPIFSAKLPAPNLQQGTARPMTGTDWYRYGYGPEQSFYSHVPQGGLNSSTAYTGYEPGALARLRKLLGLSTEGYAEGGYAVGGAGDGRDDKIPAMLSDGEYVMDAETVAMLGNGSNKAGADLLDKFRVNIRKHKGREMAKGKFSDNAKKPEQYLKGRK